MKKVFMRIIYFCLLLAILGRFDDFLRNPIVTIFLLGFDIKNVFVNWNLTTIGWILCIAIEGFIIITALEFLNYIYRKAQKTIYKFKHKNKGY